MAEQQMGRIDDRHAGDSGAIPPPLPPQTTSGLAIAALVLGMAGFFTIGLMAIPGLIVGIIALVKIDKSNGRLSGRGMAIAGTVISGVSIFFVVILAGMLVPALGRAHLEVQRTRCRVNLGSIAQATQVWSLYHGRNGAYYPPSMRALYDDGVIEDTVIFICPTSDTVHQPGEIASDYECLLDIVGEKIPVWLVEESVTPLAWDTKTDRHGGINVVYFDRHVRFIEGDDALEQVHREVEEWLNTYEAAKQEKAEPEEEQAEESP